jgi:hypothetical protein
VFRPLQSRRAGACSGRTLRVLGAGQRGQSGNIREGIRNTPSITTRRNTNIEIVRGRWREWDMEIRYISERETERNREREGRRESVRGK